MKEKNKTVQNYVFFLSKAKQLVYIINTPMDSIFDSFIKMFDH